MAAVSRLPHAEYGRNDHGEDAPNFLTMTIGQYNKAHMIWNIVLAENSYTSREIKLTAIIS